MITDKPLPQFKRRLAQTSAWCSPRANASDPQNSLRSPELAPLPFDYQRGYWEGRSEQQSQVELLADKRAQLLADAAVSYAPDGDLAGGRLLIYFPDQNLADGAGEAASAGFLDLHNAPAWDTWIWFYSDAGTIRYGGTPVYSLKYLLAWAPRSFGGLASAGIAVNPEECIGWAELFRTPILDQLRTAGII